MYTNGEKIRHLCTSYYLYNIYTCILQVRFRVFRLIQQTHCQRVDQEPFDRELQMYNIHYTRSILTDSLSQNFGRKKWHKYVM